MSSDQHDVGGTTLLAGFRNVFTEGSDTSAFVVISALENLAKTSDPLLDK